MSFKTKDFLSIVASMVNQMRATSRKITDFTIGSVARTLVEAPAVEIDELYQQMLNGLTDAIPAALFLSFSFSKLPAAKANGIVTFSRAAPTPFAAVIAAGTQVLTADGVKSYVTLATATIAAGQTSVNASVQAAQTGSLYNCGAGDIAVIQGGPSGVSVSNAAPITNGRDDETDDERQIRFREYITSLSRGTLAAIAYGAKQAQIVDGTGVVIERVTEAKPVEQYRVSGTRPLGYVDVYIYNGGSGASPTLVAQAQQQIDGYVSGGTPVEGFKSAGVVAKAQACTLQTVSFNCALRMINGTLSADQASSLNDELAAAVSGVEIGGTLFLGALAAAGLRVNGVLDLKPSLSGDLIADAGVKLVPGAFTYSVLT